MRLHLLICVGVFSTGVVFCGCLQRPSQLVGQANQASVIESRSSPTPASSPAKLLQAEPIDRTWSSKFSFDAKSIETKHDGLRGYEISVDCPQIMNDRTSATRRFNRWMLKKTRGYITEFERLERAAEIHDKKKRLKKAGINESLEIGYQVYYSDKRLISLRLTHTVMALGQMHPIDYYETINYDLRKGKPLAAGDVFRRGYLKVFSSYSRKYLRVTYEIPNDDWFNEGTAPRRDNFENWNLVPDGVLISFEDYQVSSHSFGQPELIVPYFRLRTFLKDTVTRQFAKT